VLPINTKKLANFINFFKNGEIFSKKWNKSQNIPNMKRKILNYPSIVLATYGKLNSEIGQFSHFWQLKPWKNIQFQILKFLFEKLWPLLGSATFIVTTRPSCV
jgi:hypothetical protein